MESGRLLARSMEKLKSEVIRQQVCVPRADTDVPTWLWQIIYKGLSVKPEDRYATIDSLLEDLDKDPEEVRRQKTVGSQAKDICDFVDSIDDHITNRCLVRTAVQNIPTMQGCRRRV